MEKSIDQLIEELKLVTSREKLKKYFDKEKVTELISLLNIISEKVTINDNQTFEVGRHRHPEKRITRIRSSRIS